MRGIKQRQGRDHVRRRIGTLVFLVGLVLVLLPLGRMAHARIYYELVTRGIVVLVSEPAVDTSNLPQDPGRPPITDPNPVEEPGTDPGVTPGTTEPDPGTTPGGTSGPSGTTQPVAPRPVVEPLWRISIPKLGVSRELVDGITEEDLKRGPGVYPQGAKPGEQGNLCIAGHRNAHGSPFWYLDRLKAGDEVRIVIRGKATYIYLVERLFVIEPTDWSVIAPTDYDAITLTTCHPLGSTAQRLVVRGRLARVEGGL